MKPFYKYLKKIFLLIGIAIFGYLIWDIGWENVQNSLRQIGWWWIPIIVLAVIWQVFHTFAWQQILVGLGHRPSVWQLIKLKFVAEAINMIAPSANLGGDMARAYMIKKEVPLTAGISSVMVDKTLDGFVRMLFNLIGLIVTVLFIPVNMLWIWACVAVLVVVFAGNSLLVLLQVNGFSRSVMKVARVIPPLRRKIESQEEKLHDLAKELRRIYLQRPGHLLAASLSHTIGRFLGLFEIWLILLLLSAPVNFAGSYYIAAVMNLIQSAFVLIPGQWGVAEGGQALLLESLGYTAAIGLSLGIIRRIRKLALTGMGLLFYFWQKKGTPALVPGPVKSR